MAVIAKLGVLRRRGRFALKDLKMKTKTLYLREGGKCFYCRKFLPFANSTIDHIIPKGGGGEDKEENMALCCKTLNTIMGSCDIKDKLKIIFNQVGENGFVCPDALDAEYFQPLPPLKKD
jgi:5-methylcytosine-specific restriction endonuclease McrA